MADQKFNSYNLIHQNAHILQSIFPSDILEQILDRIYTLIQ